MTARWRLLAICLVAMLLMAGQASAERRVALVIGNSAYRHATPLANPRNDAADMARKLAALGFEVVAGADLGLSEMRAKIREFVGRIDGADMALFFYAGHGLQVNGQNFLAPVDARLNSYNDLDFEALPMELVLSAMERNTKVNLIFLDACRDNPLAENLSRSMGTRSSSVGRGLAKIGTGVGSLISFATQPGNVALDGEGRNSPFTTALLRHLGTPGQGITEDLVLVRRDVLAATRGRQVPWDNSSLTGKVVLVDKAEEAPQAAPEPRRQDSSVEVAYWDTIKDASEKGYFEAYLQQYPDGAFANLAKLKIELLAARGDSPQAGRSGANPAEIAYWNSVKDAGSLAYLEAYLTRWPQGTFAEIARIRIEEMRARQTAEIAEAKAAEAKAAAEEKARQSALAKAAAEEQARREAAARLEAEREAASEAQKQVEVARLEQPQAAEPPETPTPDPEELVRAVQNELNRLGCSVGRVDGKWGPGSARALGRYAEEAGVRLVSTEPDAGLLDRLKATKARVCPLECGRGEEERNGRCEARAREASVEPKPETQPQAPATEPAGRPATATKKCFTCKFNYFPKPDERICVDLNAPAPGDSHNIVCTPVGTASTRPAGSDRPATSRRQTPNADARNEGEKAAGKVAGKECYRCAQPTAGDSIECFKPGEPPQTRVQLYWTCRKL